ncbi:hypothetical protein LPTSP4_23100 [Leptospira ryugenii]|uniref:Uncharacterized protein n=1 Tax=Leptospira ryugenii TaxID=1917863 RepID=A0A2P2E1L5_9LEPT|nr:hypothetical protein LPTSP4_23100 [Leptospira ryugenii]
MYAYNAADSPYRTLLCGPPWIYAEEESKEVELSFEFGGKWGEGSPKGSQEEGQENESEDEGGEREGKGFSSEKYKDGKWEELVENLESTSDLRKKFKEEYDKVPLNSGVADSYIKRNREYEDIIVKEVLPTLSTIRDPFKVDLDSAEDNLILHKERNRIIEEFRKGGEELNPITMKISKEGDTIKKTPLEMGKSERSQYLDRTIKQKKEKQLEEFSSRFMGYDPDKGDLSLFVRDLYYENLQRLAYPFSSDPTYFTIDYFQENLNKEDFLKQMMALLAENLGTKVGTEILFTLENIYEIQARALFELFQSVPIVNAASPEQKETIRYETLRRVIEKYKPILKSKKISDIAIVQKLYAKKRLEIIDTLIQNSPKSYRLKDAYFEKGRILWEMGRAENEDRYLEEALSVWAKIPQEREEGDFLLKKAFETLSFVLKDGELRESSGNISDISKSRIDYVLKERLMEAMNQKKLREDRLLWPKSKDIR